MSKEFLVDGEVDDLEEVSGKGTEDSHGADGVRRSTGSGDRRRGRLTGARGQVAGAGGEVRRDGAVGLRIVDGAGAGQADGRGDGLGHGDGLLGGDGRGQSKGDDGGSTHFDGFV